MVMNSKLLRPGIAMIELIFAIVIMGIVMMSAPMLIGMATQSTYVALQQEGINEAASRVQMIMGYAWDENNTNDEYRPPILNTTSIVTAFNKVGTTQRRIGIPMTSKRTFILSDSNGSNSDFNASTTLDSEGGDADDIDDFVGDTFLTLVPETIEDNTIDYVEKNTVNINTGVFYAEDNVSGGYNQSTINYVPFTPVGGVATSNIKAITVTLTSTDTANAEVLEKTIILRAFSCNIGGHIFEEKGF